MKGGFMKSLELYEKAKKLIPGGTQLLSKRPEMFLPEQWPSYYTKCKGVEVWDLDGTKYMDMSISGVSACILGYADPDVNTLVKKAINSGSMCTLNCHEEVELAELLCELHPWADMVRFARCGGEAMAIAIRIARAATGKDKVVFCGYHGWHDWYLSANLADNASLNGHLLPGLEPTGVPRCLKGTTIPFNYNKPDELDKLVNKLGKEIGVIVMEPVRYTEPKESFLCHIRNVANRINAVLIFDEVTSGWRMNVGGIHLLYRVNPDIAVFAKGMSNGYPMGAIIGRRDVMQAAQKTFISSTYWTERIGPTAALATIRKLRAHNVPKHLCRIGNRVRKGWGEIANRHQLKITIQGIPPLSTFSLDYGKHTQTLHTLFTQFMLDRMFLASKTFSITYAHQDSHVDKYLEAVDEVFQLIAQAIESNKTEKLLRGPVAHVGFRRLA